MSFNAQFARIGEVMVHKAFCTEQQVNEGLAKQGNFNLKLGETLVKLGYISERQLLESLSEQLDLEIVKESDMREIKSETVGLIPEPFAVQNRVIALEEVTDAVIVAMTDPENIIIHDGLKKLLPKPPRAVLIGEELLTDALERYYKSIRTSSEVDEAVGSFDFVAVDDEEEEINLDKDGAQADAPVVKLMNLIIKEAIKSNTTDIHIEPLTKNTRVRFRIDGALREVMSPPIGMHSGLVSLTKVMSKLNIAERRLPQDGHIALKTAVKAVDVRVSIVPTVLGEKVVMRLLDKGEFGFNLGTLGFEEQHYTVFRKWIYRPYGIIIVSGPTGSGKSTTLHSALKEIENIENNIVTVEDPVEYRLERVTQIEVKERIGLTFASALRATMRQDPDIVLLGEIRDEETADIAIKFSLTGHLVFTTLHANNAPATITRIIDIGIPAYLVGSSLNLVMAQRLVRKICPHCKTEYTPTELEIEESGLTPEEAKEIQFYIGTGCVHCDNTGYSGRTGIFELLEMKANIRKLVFDGANQDEIRDQALANGMQSLHQSALSKMRSGVTTIREVIKLTFAEE